MLTNECSLFGINIQGFSLSESSPKFFGFSEFIAGLALMVLVWTIADDRYKFRIATATIPLSSLTLFSTFTVGILTLLTDLWRAMKGCVPSSYALFTPETWQFCLATVFFLTIYIWLWAAFICPASFNRWNASRFIKTIRAAIMRGSPTELTIIADELSRSAAMIVKHATINSTSMSNADILLHLIGSPKFCQATVGGAPRLIFDLFNEMSQQRKYKLCIEVFTKNIVTAAINNKASFLYSETTYYESGLEGATNQITSALCGNPDIIESIPTLLSPSTSFQSKWDIDQWQAYYRLVLAAFTCHLKRDASERPSAFHLAWFRVKSIVDDLNHEPQMVDINIHGDIFLRLKAISELINEMTSQADEQITNNHHLPEYVLSDISDLIFSLIKKASEVKKPRIVAYRIQHDLIWNNILNSYQLRTYAGLHIQETIYHRILTKINDCPNLDSINLLGYSLNVLGFSPERGDTQYGASWRKFHTTLIEWTKENISTLLIKYPRMKRACFVEGMYYDAENNRLVKKYEYPDDNEIYFSYLDLRPPKDSPRQITK